MVLVMDVNSRMTKSWMSRKDGRIMDDKGQMHKGKISSLKVATVSL